MDMYDYVKNVLITENPALSMQERRGDVTYLDEVYHETSVMICSYVTEDKMSVDRAVRLALSNEFNHDDIDQQRTINVITRTGMLEEANRDPHQVERELSR